MTTVQDFLAKLDTVTWNRALVGSDTIEGTMPSGEVISFNLRTRLSQNNYDMVNNPLQAVASIKVDGVFATTWGSGGLKDNSALVRFFVTNKILAQNKEHQEERDARSMALDFWASL